MTTITEDNIRKLRYNQLRKQCLIEQSSNNFFDLIKSQLGFHSTDYWTPYLSAFARIGKFDAKKVFESFNTGDKLVRLNAFRRTVFAIHEDNVALILNALGPVFYESVQKSSYSRKLLKGFDSGQIIDKLCNILKGRTLKTREIKRQLPEIKDIFRQILILSMAKGLIVRATASKARSTLTSYALLSEWLPNVKLHKMAQVEALLVLLKKYIEIFGPVSVDDASWWINIPKTQVNAVFKNLERDLQEVNIKGSKYYISNEDYNVALSVDIEEAPNVFLLPYEDHFPKSFIARSWYLNKDIIKRLFPKIRQNYWPHENNPIISSGLNSSGEIRPSIWLNDRIIGRWEFEGDNKRKKVVFELYNKVDSEIGEFVFKKVQDLEDFVNQQLIPLS
ncbi:MAG: DNA glycosylase AlkZ-like family protein [Candidatus Hodarchaeales archaeon]